MQPLKRFTARSASRGIKNVIYMEQRNRCHNYKYIGKPNDDFFINITGQLITQLTSPTQLQAIIPISHSFHSNSFIVIMKVYEKLEKHTFSIEGTITIHHRRAPFDTSQVLIGPPCLNKVDLDLDRIIGLTCPVQSICS